MVFCNQIWPLLLTSISHRLVTKPPNPQDQHVSRPDERAPSHVNRADDILINFGAKSEILQTICAEESEVGATAAIK